MTKGGRRAAAGEPGAANLTIAIVVVLLLGGCALRAPRGLRPTSASELLADLAARRQAVGSLRAQARLRTGLSGLWVREVLIVRRPDAVRIDVLSPFGLALAIGVREQQLWAYPPTERVRYEGAATPANLARFLGTPITVADIVDVLLGVPPAREPAAAPTLAPAADGEYRLTVPVIGGTQTIWFAGDTLLVRRAEELRADAAAVRVAFDDYRDGFPRLIDVAAGDAAARLSYEDVELNPTIEPAVFQPPPATRILPLDAAPPPEHP